jgi:uncharacterized protein (TIGR02246 family)
MSASDKPEEAATPPSLSASAILAGAGVDEDWSYYGSFTADDERAALTVPMRIQAAWASNDADAFAAVFAAEGSLLMREDQLTSREEIRSYMAAGFRGPFRGARVSGWPLAVTFPTDEVALIVTEGGIRLAGETSTAPERQIRATWIVVRLAGAWQLISHHSSPLRS